MADAYVKQGDTWPALGEVNPIILQAGPPGSEVPINLTGATIKFLARKIDAPGTIIVGDCDIVSTPTLGQVKYQWEVGDTAVPGDYQFEFQITFGDGRVGTAPTEGYYELKITDDVGD